MIGIEKSFIWAKLRVIAQETDSRKHLNCVLQDWKMGEIYRRQKKKKTRKLHKLFVKS